MKTKDGKKKDVKPSEWDTFKKMPFFKYFLYWKALDIRHVIDGMHIQKNMFDSIIVILLDVKGKAKEGLNSCMYLVNLGIRKELHHVPLANGKYHLPAYSYNLNPNEKHVMCVCLKTLKFHLDSAQTSGVFCQ
jgi:hypothetical protein